MNAGGFFPRTARHGASPGEVVRLAILALLFLAGPTAGDIGGCSQTASDLDPARFFEKKQDVDCRRCADCSLRTVACVLACGPTVLIGFPTGCYPLVHDGEVCLDALSVATCDDYQSYMADQGSTIPTECDFCPLRSVDGGVQQ